MPTAAGVEGELVTSMQQPLFESPQNNIIIPGCCSKLAHAFFAAGVTGSGVDGSNSSSGGSSRALGLQQQWR
jgi:hypothetical protein